MTQGSRPAQKPGGNETRAAKRSSRRHRTTRDFLEAIFRHGEDVGYARAIAELDVSYNAAVRDERLRHLDGMTYAELERRRWGPRGREHFADPRPGDRHGPACDCGGCRLLRRVEREHGGWPEEPTCRCGISLRKAPDHATVDDCPYASE